MTNIIFLNRVREAAKRKIIYTEHALNEMNTEEEMISKREVLMKLKLLKNSELTNSAILLFGKNVEQFFLQSETKCILLSTSKFTKPY